MSSPAENVNSQRKYFILWKEVLNPQGSPLRSEGVDEMPIDEPGCSQLFITTADSEVSTDCVSVERVGYSLKDSHRSHVSRKLHLC
jgi:hypothetical protein